MQADQHLGVRVFRSAVHLVRRERFLGDARQGLRIPKLSALEALDAEGDKIALDELAARERVREPTLLATLGVLKALGLVQLTRARRGRRRVYVRLTEKGGEQLAQDRERLSGLFAGLTPNELAVIAEAVRILDSVLERDLEEERKRENELAIIPDEEEEEDGHGSDT